MKSKKTGFTLLELVMIILIAGILSAFILPRFISNENFNLQSGTSRVTADLRYAVDYSVNTGIPVLIEFNTLTSSYSFFQKDSATGNWITLNKPGSADPFLVNLGEGDYRGLVLTEADINNTTSLCINSMGVPLDGNMVPLTAKGSITLNSARTISIEPVTGLIKS